MVIFGQIYLTTPIFSGLEKKLRISRCIDFGGIGVGDIVVVYFTRNIDTDAGNVAEGAFSLSKGTISDGGVSIPE